MNIKECVIFDTWFVPPEEFREFFEQRGYQSCDMFQLGKMNFDPEIVQYIKDHANWHAWDKAKYSMKGAPSCDFKIGFAGAATIIEVDTDRPWCVKYSNGDIPYPVYAYIRTNEYNYTNIVFIKGE